MEAGRGTRPRLPEARAGRGARRARGALRGAARAGRGARGRRARASPSATTRRALLEAFAEEHGRARRRAHGGALPGGLVLLVPLLPRRHARRRCCATSTPSPRARREIPIDLVQLDDGYQRAVGDWLETNEKFPRGLAPVAAAIRAAGFRAGLWTAPVLRRAREPAVRGAPRLAAAPGRRPAPGPDPPRCGPRTGWVLRARPLARRRARAPARAPTPRSASWASPTRSSTSSTSRRCRPTPHDPARTRAERLRLGLEAIRAGAGDDAFLLGCGCPLGPAIGVVDGMRIGPDVAPWWFPASRAADSRHRGDLALDAERASAASTRGPSCTGATG